MTIRSMRLAAIFVGAMFAAPAIAEDSGGDVALAQARKRAALVDLTIEKLGVGAKAKILGQWYLEGLLDKECIGGFFREFRPDGSHATLMGEGVWTIHEYHVQLDSGFRIYQIDGDFVLPSAKCIFAKLVRGPRVELGRKKGANVAPPPPEPADPYAVKRAY